VYKWKAIYAWKLTLARPHGCRGIAVLFEVALFSLETGICLAIIQKIFGYMKVANICCDILLYFKNLFLM
jgi:hypothetical protein